MQAAEYTAATWPQRHGRSWCQGPPAQGMMMCAERRPPMRSRAVAAFLLAALTAGAAAGCGPNKGSSSGQSGGSPAAAPVAQCGKAHTAGGVPVEIDVQKGSASCGTAMAVERAYTRAVASGRVAGNGGGAPVTIQGWT